MTVQLSVTHNVTCFCNGSFVQIHVVLVAEHVEFAIAVPRQSKAQEGNSAIEEASELCPSPPCAKTWSRNTIAPKPFILANLNDFNRGQSPQLSLKSMQLGWNLQNFILAPCPSSGRTCLLNTCDSTMIARFNTSWVRARFSRWSFPYTVVLPHEYGRVA